MYNNDENKKPWLNFTVNDLTVNRYLMTNSDITIQPGDYLGIVGGNYEWVPPPGVPGSVMMEADCRSLISATINSASYQYISFNPVPNFTTPDFVHVNDQVSCNLPGLYLVFITLSGNPSQILSSIHFEIEVNGSTISRFSPFMSSSSISNVTCSGYGLFFAENPGAIVKLKARIVIESFGITYDIVGGECNCTIMKI